MYKSVQKHNPQLFSNTNILFLLYSNIIFDKCQNFPDFMNNLHMGNVLVENYVFLE